MKSCYDCKHLSDTDICQIYNHEIENGYAAHSHAKGCRHYKPKKSGENDDI